MGVSAPLRILTRLALGCVLAFALFAVVLIGIELALRVAGSGRDPSFVREVAGSDGKRYLRENTEVTAPFFAAGLLRHPQPFRVAKEKPKDTFRIVVLGSSAAMGDPEASFGMSRLLEKSLQSAFPHQRFEVINAAITAVNSNVVRSIASDCGPLKPDLFVVYEGNNEVIGPFGPGTVLTKSLRSPLAVHLSVALRRLRLGQWLAKKSAPAGKPAEWGGLQMFTGHEITREDPRLDDTRRLFASNLEDIVTSGAGFGAQTLLATVITNERDFPPFVSRHRAGWSAADEDAWKKLEEARVAAEAAKDFTLAANKAREQTTLDPVYSLGHYNLGRALLSAGDRSGAAGSLRMARDLDVLRFRTDTGLNDVIRSVAAEKPSEAVLVDLDGLSRHEAKDGIPGDEWFYEHVHLSFKGTYFVVSKLFGPVCDALKSRGLVSAGNPEMPSIDVLRERLGFTWYDQVMIFGDLSERFGKAPFASQPGIEERRALSAKALKRMADWRQKPEAIEAVVATYRAALAFSPDDWVLNRNFGMALLGLGKPAEALAPLRAAYLVIDDDPDLLFALARALKDTGSSAEAKDVANRLKTVEPRYPGLEGLFR